MLFRVSALGLILFLLSLVAAQEGTSNRVLGPEFNLYDADFIPEHHPDIETLVSYMTVEDAINILQRELAGAQFIGLDGVMAEHWGTTSDGEEITPQAAAVKTLKVDEIGITWQAGSYGDLFAFGFDSAVQLWTRFSMAMRDSCSGDDSPQGVVLYLLTEDGAYDVFDFPVQFSKIVPSYPTLLPTQPPVRSALPLTEPALFLGEGRPEGFAVCCFSSTGLGHGQEPQMSLEGLPLVIAAFKRLGANIQIPEYEGLLFEVPLSTPNGGEIDNILKVCNMSGPHNQRVVLCQYVQLQSLAYMKHNDEFYPQYSVPCAEEWPGDYRAQSECVEFTMMTHKLLTREMTESEDATAD